MRASIMISLGSAAVAHAGYNATTPSSTSSGYSSTPSCAAPGAYDAQGNYSCNPAHSYPGGQTCVLVNGCYILKYPASSSYSASSYSASKTSSASYSAKPTPSCPAAGSTDSKGRYSCNPAHAYPAGQTCVAVDGCYYLNIPATSYPVSSPTILTTVTRNIPSASSSSYSAKPTPSCPAAGSTDSKGRYSCNPAHAYPAGQTCVAVDGCYYLQYPSSTSSVPIVPATTSVSRPAATTSVSRPTGTQYYTGDASKASFGGLAALMGLAAFAL